MFEVDLEDCVWCQSLPTLVNLEYLHVTFENLSLQNWTVFVESLPKIAKLKALDIVYTLAEPKALTMLLDIFGSNSWPYLSELDMGMCETSAVEEKLELNPNCLANLTNLRQVNLILNGFSISNFPWFVRKLVNMRSINKADILLNSCDLIGDEEECELKIEKIVEERKGRYRFNVYDNFNFITRY